MSVLAEGPSEQRTRALEVAAERRFARADLRAEVKALGYHDGLLRVAALLADPPVEILKLDIEKLLLWVQRFGKSTSHDTLQTLGIIPNKYVRELTERQRLMLARYILAANDKERVAVLVDRGNSRILRVSVGAVLRRGAPGLYDMFDVTELASLGVTLRTPLEALDDEQHTALLDCLDLTPTALA